MLQYHHHSACRGRILVSSIKNLVDYENHQTGFERMREKFLRLSLERENNWMLNTCQHPHWYHAKNPQIHYKYIINIQCIDQIRFKSNIRGRERWKWKFRLKSRPKKDFVGWLTGVGRKEVKGILRERRKREREITEWERERHRLQDRKLERRDPNHARRWSPIETSFLLDPIDDINGSSQT